MPVSGAAPARALLDSPDPGHPKGFVPNWYVVHTFAQHEKRVDERLQAKNLPTFLPLYTLRQSNRQGAHPVEKPLFPGYVFVFVPLDDSLRVLQVPGVVKLVGSGGKPTPVADHEIESLQKARASGLTTEPHPYLEVGRKVRVVAGPFEGFQGVLLCHKGKYRVVLALELIASSFVVDVDITVVEPVKATARFGSVARVQCIPSCAAKGSDRDLIGMGGNYVSPS